MRGFFLRHGVVLLMLLAGCSGDGEPRDAARQARVEAAFGRAYAQVSEEYRASMAEVQGEGRAALESQDRRKVLAVYRAIDEATTTAARRFARLTPPQRLAGQFDDLLANLNEQRAALDRIQSAVRGNQKLTAGLQEFTTLLGELGTIQQSITAALAEE